MQTEEFVRYPSEKTFLECQKPNAKTKTWPKVREHLLTYLEKGELPWKQKGWPLGKSSQTTPDSSFRNTFPMMDVLIDIAILEKKPEKVIYWYDQLRKNKRSLISVGDDKIAAAIVDYAPERSVSIWKTARRTATATPTTTTTGNSACDCRATTLAACAPSPCSMTASGRMSRST